MRNLGLVAALLFAGCGGVDIPRDDAHAGAAGAGSGGSSAGGPATSAGVAGSGIHITPPSGSVGGSSGAGGSSGGIAAADPAGAAGYEPTTRTQGACILERIASRQAEGGAGGEGDAAAAGDAGMADAPAQGGASGGELGLGQGDLTMLVVFDKSGSMDTPWDERTRWQVANEALMKAIDGVIDNLTLGTIFFPQPAGGCDVVPLENELQIDFRTGRDFRSYWQETQTTRKPDGSTPLERSLQMADLAIEQGCRLGLLNDRFRVVLVTDGEPTCGDDLTGIVELVADWNRAGVETWVMGLPGSDPAKTLLDAIALAGATGESQSLGTPGELDHGLYDAAR